VLCFRIGDVYFGIDKFFEMKNLTVKELINACEKHKYLIFRTRSGAKYGFNSKVAEIFIKKAKKENNYETNFISFTPCNLQNYITYKLPYL
jgi:hypothetical protein